MLVLRTGAQGAGTSTFIHNNFFYDAFFLKAIGKLFYLFLPFIALLNLYTVLNRPCDTGLCTFDNGSTYQVFQIWLSD